MKVLVTGANGFLGRIIVNELREKHRVFALIRSGSLKTENVNVIHGDLCNFDFVNWLFSKYEFSCIINCAALLPTSGVSGANFDDNILMADNIVRVLNQKTHDCVVIHLSSCSVYENSSNKTNSENDPVDPSTGYAKTKWQSELTFQKLRRDIYKLNILRLAGVHGPSRTGGFFQAFMESQRTGTMMSFSAPKKIFHPLFENEMIDVINWVLTISAMQKNRCQNVFNVASALSLSLEDWVEACFKVAEQSGYGGWYYYDIKHEFDISSIRSASGCLTIDRAWLGLCRALGVNKV